MDTPPTFPDGGIIDGGGYQPSHRQFENRPPNNSVRTLWLCGVPLLARVCELVALTIGKQFSDLLVAPLKGDPPKALKNWR